MKTYLSPPNVDWKLVDFRWRVVQALSDELYSYQKAANIVCDNPDIVEACYKRGLSAQSCAGNLYWSSHNPNLKE